ncbi:MAG TPA: hypothetical protein PKD85_00070 [Saprospiraceae bacterium]|nr:hypothetical protein [Saprospiraceae bacterium]
MKYLKERLDWKKVKKFCIFVFTWFCVGMLLSFIKVMIYANDYLNPFTLTFKNPKTVEMLNIIILYHYVMAFLVGIIVFTFIFIFLAFFRSYPFFYIKPGNIFEYEEAEKEEADLLTYILMRKSD